MTHRAVEQLATATKEYPGAWQQVENLRADRAKGSAKRDWPDWCYIPTEHLLPSLMRDMQRRAQGTLEPINPQHVAAQTIFLAGLAAWRQSKGIYTFDPDLLESIIHTKLTGNLPVELLYRLPAWAIYLELPEGIVPPTLIPGGKPTSTHGAFVWLDFHPAAPNPTPADLVIALDITESSGREALYPFVIDLKGGLTEGIEKTINNNQTVASMSVNERANLLKHLTQLLHPIVNLVLYLCSDAPDYSDRQPPGNAKPKKTKKGVRTFPPHAPTRVKVGARIGAAIRKAREDRQNTEAEILESGRAKPITHVRNAHWHLYWTGPRKGPRTPIIKWLPPTIVNATDDTELPAVIRPIKPSEE